MDKIEFSDQRQCNDFTVPPEIVRSGVESAEVCEIKEKKYSTMYEK
jgi:hypothetical protein